LIQVTNDHGNVLFVCTYDANNKLQMITDDSGRSVNYTFSQPDGISIPCLFSVSQFNTTTALWQYGYTAYAGFSPCGAPPLLQSILSPSPTGNGMNSLSFTYDDCGRVIAEHDPGGNILSFSYTGGSTCVTTTDTLGTLIATKTQNFTQQGFNAGYTDSSGANVTIAYADANNPYTATTISMAGKTFTKTCDQQGNVTTQTTPFGSTVNNTYSANGRLLTSSKNGVQTASYTYLEPYGLVKTLTTPQPGSLDGSATISQTTKYDVEMPGQGNFGQVVAEIKPGNNGAASLVTTYNYTTDGNYTQPAMISQPVTMTNSAGQTSHYRYDIRGNVISSTDYQGRQTIMTYNLADQVLEVDGPITAANKTPYIILRHRKSIGYLYAGGPVTNTKECSVYYDNVGNATLGIVREIDYSYDAAGQLLSKSGDTQSASYTYDALGHVISLTDGKENTISFNYDIDLNTPAVGLNTKGLLTSIVYPDGKSINFTSYDTSGNQLQRSDGNGVQINYTYGDNGRLSAVTYPATPQLNIAYSYDSANNLIQITDAESNRYYDYDTFGNILDIDTSYGSNSAGGEISYAYNTDGTRQSMTTPAGTYLYDYNASGDLASLVLPNGQKVQWKYDADGGIAKQILGNHAWTNYTYDQLGRLASETNYNPHGRVLSDFSAMRYNAMGSRESERISVPGIPTASGMRQWKYDLKGQLKRDQWTPAVNTGFAHEFSYDNAGNPTHYAPELTGYDGQTRCYNQNNQWVGYGGPNDETLFQYDGNGNPTTYEGNHLFYDANNALIAYANAAGQTQMSAGYRSDGKRAWREVNGQRIYFLYDGEQQICELDSNSNVLAYNSYGATGLVARNDVVHNRVIWYQFDPQGNVLHRLDITGHVRSTDLYDAHGLIIYGGDNSDPNGFGAQCGY